MRLGAKSQASKLGLDEAVENFRPRRARRFGWDIDPATFEPEFFDPDADGIFAPSPLSCGWPHSLTEAHRWALSDLKAKRRRLNHEIRKLERVLGVTEATVLHSPTKARDGSAGNGDVQGAPAIPADHRGRR